MVSTIIFFPWNFNWCLLKPFNQSKMQYIFDFINNDFGLFVHEFSLTRIGQISSFSSLSIWTYIQHAMVQKQVHLIVYKNRHVPTDWGGFTTPNLTSLELFRSIFNTIPVYWQNTVGNKTGFFQLGNNDVFKGFHYCILLFEFCNFSFLILNAN